MFGQDILWLTLNMGNFFLLLGVGLHLVDLVFGLCSDIGRVVTTVVDHLLLGGQVHDVGTNFIHEIGGVRGKDLPLGLSNHLKSQSYEDVVVSGQVGLEPDDGSQIQMRGGLVKKQNVWLDEKGSGKRDTHSPTTRHVLGGLSHHDLGETKTGKNGSGFSLEHGRVHLLEFFVDSFQGELIDIVGNRHLLGELLETSHLLLCGGDNVVESVNIGWFYGTADKVDLTIS